MRNFKCEIVTPEGSAFSGEIESIILTTTEGDVELMAGHADFMAALDTGKIRIREDGKDHFASSSGGFVTVKGGLVKVVCTTFEFSEDIDLARAERAVEKAEEKLRNAKTDTEIELAKAKLKRAISRIKISGLRR